AERLGCKESTLVVRCSIAGISLRGPKRLQLRPGVSLTLSRETIASLSARAAANGCSEAQLASDLLETIARDGLYDAVLDSAPLAPDTEFSGTDLFAARPEGSDEARLTGSQQEYRRGQPTPNS